MGNVDPTKQIVLLTGPENFEVWEEAVITYLRSQGLWRVVAGISNRPVKPTRPSQPVSTTTSSYETRSTTAARRATPAPISEGEGNGSDGEPDSEDEESIVSRPYKKAIEKFEKLLAEWEQNDEKAHGTICSTVSREIRHEVVKLSTSREVWEAIREKYNIVSSVQSFEGLQTAINTQYDNCNGVQQYVTKLTTALDKFETSLRKSEKLPESVRIQFLLCNLSKT